MHKTINSTEFRKMILVGAKQLEINRAKVDALNVFPVPDGDTGTNMSLTMQSCVKELSACQSNAFSEVCNSVSRGALKGARGNSGVILSQILKNGITQQYYMLHLMKICWLVISNSPLSQFLSCWSKSVLMVTYSLLRF